MSLAKSRESFFVILSTGTIICHAHAQPNNKLISSPFDLILYIKFVRKKGFDVGVPVNAFKLSQ